MKNRLPLFFAFFCVMCCASADGQNYQCLQSGVTHYFINGNNYLRGIRIDSSKVTGDTIVYYPYHTARGAYNYPSVMPFSDTNGGSWLGKKVLQLTDGTFIFDNYWDSDSVILKTQAHTGDSWVFFRDTGSLYYKATVVSADTMTILSVLDSVKNILVTAQNASGIVTTDPLDSFTIILGKNSGFVQVFDLYTFPYHKPDSAYRQGQDFFLDRSTEDAATINTLAAATQPTAFTAIFNLVDFVLPNDVQLHNWDMGDIFESIHTYGMSPFSITGSDFIGDTIISKSTTAHTVTYTLNGTNYSCTHGEPCGLISNAGTYVFSDSHYSIADPGFIPEQLTDGIYLFYYPQDNSDCLSGPRYQTVLPGYIYIRGLDFTYENAMYKWGMGRTGFYHFDDENIFESDNIVYSKIDSVSCGYPLGTPAVSTGSDQLQVFPNPASTELNIVSSEKIKQITLTDILGAVVYDRQCYTEKIQLDIAFLPTGVYFLKINNMQVRKFVKQ